MEKEGAPLGGLTEAKSSAAEGTQISRLHVCTFDSVHTFRREVLKLKQGANPIFLLPGGKVEQQKFADVLCRP